MVYVCGIMCVVYVVCVCVVCVMYEVCMYMKCVCVVFLCCCSSVSFVFVVVFPDRVLTTGCPGLTSQTVQDDLELM